MQRLLFVLLVSIASMAYAQQKEAPRVDTQQQAKDRVGTQANSEDAKPTTFSQSLRAKGQQSAGGHETAEVTILGARIGEWAIVVVTFLLFLATRDLVREAKDSSERQLRAYLSMVTATRVVNLGNQNAPKFEVNFRNSGQTPAYAVGGACEIEVREYPLSGRLKVLPVVPDEERMLLGPGIDFILAKTKEPALTPEERKGVNDGKMAIYIVARVEYRDIFKKNQHAIFVGRCHGDQGVYPQGTGDQAT
jgi:hypothetical protein